MSQAKPWYAFHFAGKPPRWRFVAAGVTEAHALRRLHEARPLAHASRLCVSQELPEHVPVIPRGRPRKEEQRATEEAVHPGAG
jgi:hypothetical protein